MQIKYDDFIGTYTDVYDSEYCNFLINAFEDSASKGAGSDRVASEGARRDAKDDYNIFAELDNSFPRFKGRGVSDVFFDGLQQCYDKYRDKYSVINQIQISAHAMKLQRSEPGQGYHIWHAEQGNGNPARRVLVYILYLNTLSPEQAGETEFLYLQKRVRPVENTLVIWPAAFTHAHRGNPVFGSKNKYIATGWFNAS